MDTERIINGIARFIKYNTKVIFVFIFFAGLISVAIFGNKGIIQRFRLEAERKDLEEQLNSEIQKSQDLQKQIEELKTSDEVIEKIAREKYGMTKEGEKVYKVLVDSTK